MDGRIGSVLDASMALPKSLNQCVNEMSNKIDQLEQKLNEVEQFYSNSSTKPPNIPRGDSFLERFNRRHQDAASREAAATQRMQDLMRQFGIMLRQITQHKWAEPFMQPVDVVGLRLHDYHEVIEKPMDFSTIQSKMEAKDGTGYKNVREIHADVRLIFKNAMTYNDKRADVHVMAKTLLDNFDRKWLQLLPKVDEEEARQKEEEAEMQLDMYLEQEAAHARMARDLRLDLDEVDTHLKELKAMALQNCRKMTTEEKVRLGSAMTRLSLEDITKALEMIGQNDPTFQAAKDNVDVDIDAQSESTLWQLKYFVKEKLQAQEKSSTSSGGNNGDNNIRTREISEATAKASKKKSKKP